MCSDSKLCFHFPGKAQTIAKPYTTSAASLPAASLRLSWLCMSHLVRELSIIAVLTAVGTAFSLFSGLAPLPWAAPELGAGEIRVEDARVLDVLWIDARGEDAYQQGHIGDAIRLSPDNWDDGILELMDAWLGQPRPIVVYCGSAGCGSSKRVAERLREALASAEIYTLHGGWDAWVQ
jgi:rhodanese-related sulfurtransferase